MSKETLNLTRLKLYLGKNIYEGHDSVLDSVRIPVRGQSFKYDVDEDAFYAMDLDNATADIIKYDGEKMMIDDKGDEHELVPVEMFRPLHLDRNTGKKLELSYDFTKVEFETTKGEVGSFRVQDLYSENIKQNYPIDESVLDHMVLKMHSVASTNVDHEIVGEDIDGILVDGLDINALQSMVIEIAGE